MAKKDFLTPRDPQQSSLVAKVNKMQQSAQQRQQSQGTPDLFDDNSAAPTTTETHPVTEQAERKRPKLLPIRHDRDFFLADLLDYAMKDDGASMEAPIFTLATQPDLSTWHWQSKDGNRTVTVTPSVLGRATQHDKDVIILR